MTGESKIQNPRFSEASDSKLQATAAGANGAGWNDARVEDMMLREEGARYGNDLEERLAVFDERAIALAKRLPKADENRRLKDQLVGAGTSVGANFCEATESVSKKDFRHSISRCKKEAKEARFFIRMAVASEPALAEEARSLYREATEILLIFAAIYRK